MILSRLYSIAGEMDGMPIIQEDGLCTDDHETMAAIRKYENEALQFSRIPRRSGLTVKTLDGTGAPQLFTIADPQIGRFERCVQNGRTKTAQVAPVQPIGPLAGKAIIRYSRTWVQLQE